MNIGIIKSDSPKSQTREALEVGETSKVAPQSRDPSHKIIARDQEPRQSTM